MTIPFAQLDVRLGNKDARDFTSKGEYAPWPGGFESAQIEFKPPFEDDKVRVFLTPTRDKIGPSDHHAAVVGVAHRVNRNGFELWARSTDCAVGSSSFNWLAVAPKLKGERRPDIDVRMARIQPLKSVPNFTRLSPDCQPGDTESWPKIPHTRPIDKAEVFLTQICNVPFNPAGLLYSFPPWAATVGMLQQSGPDGFHFAARNFDIVFSAPRYNYIAFAQVDPTKGGLKISDLRVALGDRPFFLKPGGQFGDWDDDPVYFDAPFLAPPIVLMTAQTEPGQSGRDLRAFHGIANSIDQYGFTAMARSADHLSGTMRMNWIAFGCGEACGG